MRNKTKTTLKKLGRFIKVRPIISNRSGEAVRNQYCLEFENGDAFQSYSSLVGVFVKSEARYYFSKAHDYSTTTSKYCASWCGMNGKERREAIKSGQAGMLDTDEME